MIPQTPQELVALAWERYEQEPIFHARVYKAASAIMTEIKQTGMPWSRSFDGVITAAAATGLLMADIHDPETGEYLDFHGEAGRAESNSERDPGLEPEDQSELNGHGPAQSD